jgi:glycosyltransferase involved in cell wall biosynthesis
MKILLIHRYYWPDHPNCGQILWHLTKHFSLEGHEIEVLTSLPSKDFNSKNIFAKKIEIFKNIKIRRINLSVENKNPIKKIINGLILGFWTNYLAIKNNYNVVISTSIPPITGGFFAALAAYFIKARFIYFCMDLHPEVGKIYKDFSNPILYKLFKKIDIWSCSRANPIVVHSKDMKNSIELRDKVKNFKIEIINNFSIPTKKIHKLKSKNNLVENNKKLVIIFAGNLGRFQSLDTVIEAMKLLKNRKNIQLIIMGDGIEKTNLVYKVKKNNANVLFLNRQPANVAKYMINKADIGLVSLSPNVYKYGYPSKIMTYLEQGKPIIAVLEKESEIIKLMEFEKYGFCIDRLDPKKISELFIKLANNNSWKLKMKKKAKNAYKKYFSKNIILSKWSNILLYK